MREIVLDTETTGLDPKTGDRVVEIGAIEMVNRFLTGRTFHVYINPERTMPPDAFRVHGLSDGFLKDKPKFAEIARDFLEFIADDMLVIHNASFDIGFLNAELARLGHAALATTRVVDSLMLARRKHPGQQNSLDKLCERYGIDNTKRVRHGALLDAELLAEVYAELTGGRQQTLGLSPTAKSAATATLASGKSRRVPQPVVSVSGEDLTAHQAFVKTLGATAVWRGYLEIADETGAEKPAPTR